MTLTEILIAQLTDPFRVGLIMALVFTMLRTAPVTGRVIPLLAGLVFVAVIIPVTLPPAGGAPLPRLVGVGLLANALLLAAVLGLRALAMGMRR